MTVLFVEVIPYFQKKREVKKSYPPFTYFISTNLDFFLNMFYIRPYRLRAWNHLSLVLLII